jgi:MFS family permease
MTPPALAPQDPAQRVPTIAWMTLALLLLAAILAYLDRQIIALLVPHLRADFGLSDFQIGILQGPAFALVYAAAGLPFGMAVDRHSRSRVIAFAVSAWATATALTGFSTKMWHLFLARAGVGLGEAGLNPAAYSMISDLFPKTRVTLALAIFTMGQLIGIKLAYGVGALIIEQAEQVAPHFAGGRFGVWQLVFLWLGLASLVLSPLVLMIREPERRGKSSSTSKGSFTQALQFMASRRQFFISHFCGFGSLTLLAYAANAWLPAILTRVCGWSLKQTGGALSLLAIAGIAGLLFCGRSIDSMVRRGLTDAHFRFYSIAAVAVALAASAFFSTNGLVIIGGYAIIQFVIAVSGSAAATLQIVTPNEIRGRISSIYLVFHAVIGLGLGPTFVGALTDFVFRDDMKVGWSLAVVFFIFAPLSACSLYFGRRHLRTAVEAAEEWSAPVAPATR